MPSRSSALGSSMALVTALFTATLLEANWYVGYMIHVISNPFLSRPYCTVQLYSESLVYTVTHTPSKYVQVVGFLPPTDTDSSPLLSSSKLH